MFALYIKLPRNRQCTPFIFDWNGTIGKNANNHNETI